MRDDGDVHALPGQSGHCRSEDVIAGCDDYTLESFGDMFAFQHLEEGKIRAVVTIASKITPAGITPADVAVGAGARGDCDVIVTQGPYRSLNACADVL